MSNNDWWSRKMGQPAQQPRPSVPMASPPPAQYTPPVQPQYPPSQQVRPQSPNCPNCGSGNYGGATPETRPRCYDCGYPIVQSGSGGARGIVGQQQSEGPTKAAMQVPTGGWNPQTIIGRIE